ncbi:MAG: hypothetical protein IPN68_14280 [Bacteroidetes bacterium]|nr:hypothetical protein [Bacteroidota bacterium]
MKGLAPKSNIKAWVDRKAFIHNLGHATAAYYGHFLHPMMTYTYEILEDRKVFDFTRKVMMQSAEVLNRVYSEDLPMKELENHVDDLLNRFRNRALQDTIFRVGQDLIRKLAPDDRFMGAIQLAREEMMPYDLIVKAMAYGFFFDAKDEAGKPYAADDEFLASVSADIETAITGKLNMNNTDHKDIIRTLQNLYLQIKNSH